jgi:hypothetical protein
VSWLRKLGVSKLRTGISWADWYRPNAVDWFDRQMNALKDFDVTLTFCFTPPSISKNGSHTGAPTHPEEFASFVEQVVMRYMLCETEKSDGRCDTSGGVQVVGDNSARTTNDEVSTMAPCDRIELTAKHGT